MRKVNDLGDHILLSQFISFFLLLRDLLAMTQTITNLLAASTLGLRLVCGLALIKADVLE
jgi:hypothetical protein